MKDIAESAARWCVIVIAPQLLLAKNPSNRGRTSDLGIAQCFPLQSHALPTELSKAHYLSPKEVYNEQMNKSRLSIPSRGLVFTPGLCPGPSFARQYPLRRADG
jgi:hypothetical protein